MQDFREFSTGVDLRNERSDPFFPPGTSAVTLGGAARHGLAAQRLLLEHPPPAPKY